MASSVNRRTTERGRIVLLPRRYNRTAVDRFANGCEGLSDPGVSMKLHQTLIQGSATGPRKVRRLWDRNPTPKKLVRTPTPALQNAGLVPQGRPSSVLARREGSPTAIGQKRPPEIAVPGPVPGANPSIGGPRLRRQRRRRARRPRQWPSR